MAVKLWAAMLIYMALILFESYNCLHISFSENEVRGHESKTDTVSTRAKRTPHDAEAPGDGCCSFDLEAVIRNMTGCCGEQYMWVNDQSRTLSTPICTRTVDNFTTVDVYPKYADCSWTLDTDVGRNIRISSQVFSLEESTDCTWDYLEVIDGDYTQRYCGYKALSFISTTNTLRLRFHSDETYEATGIILEYVIANEGDDSSKCNSHVTQPGVITSPVDAANSTYVCLYRITAPPDKVVQLQFVDLSLPDCASASLTVYDGMDTVTGAKLGEFCGQRSRPSSGRQYLQSTSRDLFVYFDSYAFAPDTGFRASVHFVDWVMEPSTPEPTTGSVGFGDDDCSYLIDDQDSGIVTSPGYPGSYPIDKHCVVFIQNHNESVIELTLTNFDVEKSANCSWDFLQIFEIERLDAENVTRSLKDDMSERLCGAYDQLDKAMFSTKREGIYLVFHSDESIGWSGYNASFEIKIEHCHGCDESTHVCAFDQDEYWCVPGRPCIDSTYCNNGGQCVDEDGDHSCYCPSHFSGDRCQEQQVEPAIFVKRPVDGTVQKGSSYTLECEVNDRLAKYHWFFKESALLDDDCDIAGYEVSPGGSILHLCRFEEQHEGQYICQAESSEGGIQRTTFTLTQIEDCNLPVRRGPRSGTFTVNTKSVILWCDVVAADRVTWFKDKVPLTIVRGKYKLMGRRSHHLSILNIAVSDEGQYTCHAWNDIEQCKVSRTATLRVVRGEPDDSVCGQLRIGTSNSPQTRIVHGHTAEKGSAPWHVMLYNTVTDEVFCGGSLLSNTWVVTAAHCLKGFTVDEFKRKVKAVLGTNNCKGRGGTSRQINRFVIHDGYKDAFSGSDIALVELTERIEYTDVIIPICLRSSSYINKMFLDRSVGNSVGRVVGCGSEVFKGTKPTWLHEVRVPYKTQGVCEESSIAQGFNVSENVFCAGYAYPNKGDSCDGDSGGSFTMRHDPAEDRATYPYYLVGIVSWGYACDAAGTFGYYTNVAMFYDWIQNEIAR